MPAFISKDARSLLTGLLTRDPDKRLGFGPSGAKVTTVMRAASQPCTGRQCDWPVYVVGGPTRMLRMARSPWYLSSVTVRLRLVCRKSWPIRSLKASIGTRSSRGRFRVPSRRRSQTASGEASQHYAPRPSAACPHPPTSSPSSPRPRLAPAASRTSARNSRPCHPKTPQAPHPRTTSRRWAKRTRS